MLPRNSAILTAVCAVAVLAVSCGEKKDAQSQAAAQKSVMANMTSKPAVTFGDISSKIANMPRYDFFKTRDPFFAAILQASVKQTKASGTVKGLLAPTQKFQIDKYNLIGVIIDKRGRSAIFDDPEGKGWVVKEGMPLGNEGAKIKKISADSVTVEEAIIDSSGRQKSLEKTIPIKKGR